MKTNLNNWAPPSLKSHSSSAILLPEHLAQTKDLLTRTEAATHLGISPLTLATWASNRRVDIPYAKIGRRVMYRRADLDAFIAANLKGVAATKEPQ